jgi:hypothetical protein
MIPRWIITQKTMPFGCRQDKKPVLVVVVEDSWSHAKSYGSWLHRDKDAYQPLEIPGLFKNWEYRFWAMVPTGPGKILAECRCCGNMAVTCDTPTRQLHFAKGGCTKRLCAAYDLLLKDSKCLICDHWTSSKKFGVPICGSACLQAFCESEPQPKALAEALALVGEEGWT